MSFISDKTNSRDVTPKVDPTPDIYKIVDSAKVSPKGDIDPKGLGSLVVNQVGSSTSTRLKQLKDIRGFLPTFDPVKIDEANSFLEKVKYYYEIVQQEDVVFLEALGGKMEAHAAVWFI